MDDDQIVSYITMLELMNEPVTEYDDSLVRKLIEQITVYDDRCDVEFKSGIIVEVYI